MTMSAFRQALKTAAVCVVSAVVATPCMADCRSACLAELRSHPRPATRALVDWEHVEKSSPCVSVNASLSGGDPLGAALDAGTRELSAPRDAEFVPGTAQLRDYEGSSSMVSTPTAIRVRSVCSASRLAAWRVSAKLRMSDAAACAYKCGVTRPAASVRPRVLSCTGDQAGCRLKP
jgi:hypothetical protein